MYPSPTPSGRTAIKRTDYFWLLMLALCAALIGGSYLANAQARDEKPATSSFSLKQAIAYAHEHNANTANAALDVESARSKVRETVALGLPQINATGQYAQTYNVQQVILENEPGTPFSNPFLPAGAVLNFGLQLPHSMSGAVTLQQMIFNGSYLVGLQASNTYIKLSQKNLQASKITIAENVSKAYYGVLVNRERGKLLGVNIARVDSTLAEMKAMQKQGFVEKLDVDRLEVTRNNLVSERDKVNRFVELSEQLLKFQMGYPQTTPITLTDKLSDQGLTFETLPTQNVDYTKRIEFSTLEVQRELARLELKNINSGYLPSLYGSYSMGSNTASSRINKLTEGNRWFFYDQIGVQLQVPIFDGFGRHHKAQQAKINLRKVENGFEQLKQGIDLELAQSNTNLLNARETMQTQRRNMDLAAEVLRVARIKYKQGVGTNLEVTSAESDLKEAQLNYYNAVYDALIAKVDQQKASGTLYTE